MGLFLSSDWLMWWPRGFGVTKITLDKVNFSEASAVCSRNVDIQLKIAQFIKNAMLHSPFVHKFVVERITRLTLHDVWFGLFISKWDGGNLKDKKKKDLSHENKVTGHHFRQLLTIPQILLVRTMENVYMTVRRIDKLILRTKELTSRAKFSVSQCSPFQAVTGNIYRQ